MVQQLHDANDISEAGQIQLCDKQHTVGYFHNSHIESVKGLADIDDQVREGGLQEGQDSSQVIGSDHFRVFKFDWAGQQECATRMSCQRSFEQAVVQSVDAFHDVLDCVLGYDIQPDVGVAEREIEVDNDRRILTFNGQCGTGVYSQSGASDTTGHSCDGYDSPAA